MSHNKNSQREHLPHSSDFYRILERSCCLSNKSQDDLNHQSPLPLLLPSCSIKGRNLSQVFFPNGYSRQLCIDTGVIATCPMFPAMH